MALRLLPMMISRSAKRFHDKDKPGETSHEDSGNHEGCREERRPSSPIIGEEHGARRTRKAIAYRYGFYG